MNRNAPGSGDELDIPMDGRKTDRPPRGVAFKQVPKATGKGRRRSWSFESNDGFKEVRIEEEEVR
jgi:hypothetical protein